MNALIAPPTAQETPSSTREALGHAFDIGDFSYGVPTVFWWREPATLVIGKFCSFSNGVEIFLGGNHRVDWTTTYPFSHLSHWPEAAHLEGHPATKGDVRIGNDVWVGYKAMILSGVTLGDGAVVGAGAVVSSDVPAYAIVAGNPARVIRLRFSIDIIQRLLEVRWWEWEIGRIRDHIPLLMQPDILKFLEACDGTGTAPVSSGDPSETRIDSE